MSTNAKEVELTNETTRMTSEGKNARSKQLAGRQYSEKKEYGVNEETYINSDKAPLAKGSGTENKGDEFFIPGQGGPKTIKKQFDTNNGGNVYDINGTGGKSGRNNLMTINKYTPQSFYGVNSPKADDDIVKIIFNTKDIKAIINGNNSIISILYLCFLKLKKYFYNVV